MAQHNLTTGKEQLGKEHQASARSLSIPVSTKHSIEIAKAVRYKTTTYAKKFLEDVVALKRAVEFKTYNRNVGHKVGMAAGRFPQKAAQQFLKLLHSVEANAQFRGLNVDDLKIVKLTANLASIPMGGGRQRHKTKRTHLEIVVKERSPAAKKNKRGTVTGNSVKSNVSEKVADKVMDNVRDTVRDTVKDKVTDRSSLTESSPKISSPEQAGKTPVAVSEAATVHHPTDNILNKKAVGETKSPVFEKNNEKKREREREKETTAVSEEVSTGRVVVSKQPGLKSEPPKPELTSQELLKRAQARAAELNQRQSQEKSVEEVSKLYAELSQKGTLRNTKMNTVKKE
ncbi:50S ribosomal protein L22 [Candidatus Woesearchaeota archaeon]|nr:50S ribosomal protein L22 [Candidatus Woesearchaeota archaeon]